MKFNNRHNTPHNIDGRIVWESRSVAALCVIMLYRDNDENCPYILVSERGIGSPDHAGKMNLVAGYLDWCETGTECVYREAWEETGFNLPKHLEKFKIEFSSLDKPWYINTDPSDNRLQNISLHYGIVLKMSNNDTFPELTNQYNDVPHESENPIWMSINDIDKYVWAFEHDKVILNYKKIYESRRNL